MCAEWVSASENTIFEIVFEELDKIGITKSRIITTIDSLFLMEVKKSSFEFFDFARVKIGTTKESNTLAITDCNEFLICIA